MKKDKEDFGFGANKLPAEMLKDVEKDIGKLSDKELILFKLAGGYQLTYDEVGKLLGITKMGAKKLEERALAKLRKGLEKNGIKGMEDVGELDEHKSEGHHFKHNLNENQLTDDTKIIQIEAYKDGHIAISPVYKLGTLFAGLGGSLDSEGSDPDCIGFSLVIPTSNSVEELCQFTGKGCDEKAFKWLDSKLREISESKCCEHKSEGHHAAHNANESAGTGNFVSAAKYFSEDEDSDDKKVPTSTCPDCGKNPCECDKVEEDLEVQDISDLDA